MTAGLSASSECSSRRPGPPIGCGVSPPRPPLSPAPALRPLLADFVLSMPRGAQVIYPTEGQARDSTVDWVHLKLNDDDCLAVTRSWVQASPGPAGDVAAGRGAVGEHRGRLQPA